MSKEKTKLEKASDEVKSLVQSVNTKINELGICDEALYNALSIIQNQFDMIRNVPSDTMTKYQKIKKVRLTWKQHVDKINEDYETAKKANVGMGAAGAGLGASVVFLGPTAAMGIATTFGVASTGTAIAALHGAAATNAALAWLGGGALAAGGGGMAAGNALLALAGPIGWAIAGISILGSGLLFWKALSEKKRLEEIFLLISKRDKTSYELAIVELNERINRITAETLKLQAAIMTIGTFGTDYNKMSEEQQYTLGAYVNLMNASTQLLVNPILGLQPKYKEEDLRSFLSFNSLVGLSLSYSYINKNKDLIIYIANLLYKIETEESDRKLLAKSFKKNKNFLKEMKLNKDDMSLDLFNLVDRILKHLYVVKRK